MKRKAETEIICISSDEESNYNCDGIEGGGGEEEEDNDDDVVLVVDDDDDDDDDDDEEERKDVRMANGDIEIEEEEREFENDGTDEECEYTDEEMECEDSEDEDYQEEDTDDDVVEDVDECVRTSTGDALILSNVRGSPLCTKKRTAILDDGSGAANSVHQSLKCNNSSKSRCGPAIKKTTLSKEDWNYYNEALKMIRSGEDLEKLKVEQCKAYLRHYSLRLTGSKSILIQRMQEHLEIKGGNALIKYPRSTFTINCTGDACTGDVVLFKQRVYKRSQGSSSRHLVGDRVVAGRIVKESYGTDKQQHTFTIEVLWSKGPKQLPLLYPLMIKGRNLYRHKTFRQPWPNEVDRQRVLEEKHMRGRTARDARFERLAGKRGNSKTSSTRQRVTTTSDTKGKGKNVSRATYGSKCTANATECLLNITASSAGTVIGTHGRNIIAISATSGAKVDVYNDASNPTMRIVKVIGLPEQIKIATKMVRQRIVERGFPSPTLRTN